MPNWCFNEIKASEKVLKQIYDLKKEEVTFEKIMPMPKTLLVTAGSQQKKAILYALIKMNNTQREETLKKLNAKQYDYYNDIIQYIGKDEKAKENLQELYKINKEYEPDKEERDLGIKNFNKLGNTYISNIIKYGYADWYGWRNNYWGTKWDACNSSGSPKEGFLCFETAWSPPEGIVKKLFEMFPNEDINWYYEEPGMGFAGNYTPDNEGGVIDTPCPVPNYSEEDEEEMEK